MLKLFPSVCVSQILWEFISDCRTTHAEAAAANMSQPYTWNKEGYSISNSSTRQHIITPLKKFIDKYDDCKESQLTETVRDGNAHASNVGIVTWYFPTLYIPSPRGIIVLSTDNNPLNRTSDKY